MLIIGIDPGIKGAICILKNGKILDVFDMPIMPVGKKNKSQVNASQIYNEIQKVIIKVELKDELFEGEYGKKLKESGIYIVKSLSPTINALHDDHYHVDFKEM